MNIIMRQSDPWGPFLQIGRMRFVPCVRRLIRAAQDSSNYEIIIKNMSKKENESWNTDEKEKARKLSGDEQKRLEQFEVLAETMRQKGYRRTDLTVSIIKANIFAVGLLIPVAVIGFALFMAVNRGTDISFRFPLWFIPLYFVLIAVHELIHGLTWAVFTENHLKDIAFGFMVQYLTPYCSCRVPLARGPYITGALMPLLVLGILPMVYGILQGSLPVLCMGILMADGAAGDIMIVRNIRKYHSDSPDVVYIDHPTQAGGVIFEKADGGMNEKTPEENG